MRTNRFLSTLLVAASSFPLLVAKAAELPANHKAGFQGVIEVVNVDPKGGPASLTVKADDGRQWTVLLGSIRHLIDNNFNPKAGQKIEATGFVSADGQLVANQVTLPEVKKTLWLRDAEGRPLWRGPRRSRPKQ
jgi:hypothetical protein